MEPASGRVIGSARTNDAGRVVFNNLKVDAYDLREKNAVTATPTRVTVTKTPVVVDVVVPKAIR